MNTYLDLRNHPRDARGVLIEDTPLSQLVEESIQAVRSASQSETNDEPNDAPNASTNAFAERANVRAWLSRLGVAPAQLAIGAVLIAVAIGLFFVLLGRAPSAVAPAQPPVATPARTAASVGPTVPPATAPPAPAAIVAYFDYADPETVTAIEARQIVRVVGQASSDWRLVSLGDARVWVAARQIPAGVPSDDPLPDLRPRPTTVPVVAPAAPPATRCAEVGIPDKMVSVCGTADLGTLQQQAQAEWLATYGGNVGTVGQPTPQVREP